MFDELQNAEMLAAIPNCPGTASGRDCKAYRFVHSDKAHVNNFLPLALIDPARKLPGDIERCSSYALSLYETREQAVTDYNNIKKVAKKFPKQAGDCVAEVTLRPIDGVATSTDHRGHFDFFPNKTVDLPSQSEWLGTIESKC